MIIIDIKNPLDIASRESLLAKAIGNLAPKLVRRKVEEGVIKSLQESFRERGIEADFTIQENGVRVGDSAIPPLVNRPPHLTKGA